MKTLAYRLPALLLLVLALLAPSAFAQSVQIAPVVSYRSGGSFSLPTTSLVVRPDSDMALGGTVDISFKPTWRLELAYSRQQTKIDGPYGGRLGVNVENYFVGLQEELGAELDTKTRPFGTILVGMTRFVPDFPANERTNPAAGLALGFKYLPSKHVGLRLEGRGVMTFTAATGDALCGGGTCYLNYSGSTFWQWEFSAGAIIGF